MFAVGAPLVAAAAAYVPLAEDKLRCLLALALAYPLSLPLLFVRGGATFKHVYIVITAAILALFCFPSPTDLAHLVAAPLAVYAILALGVATKGAGPLRVGYVFACWAVVLGHMAYSHLHRQINDYGSYKFDHTAPQMLMVLKLTGFAWCVFDYYSPKTATANERARRMATPLPPFLEYLAYVFYFGGLFVGPAFEYADFRAFISGVAFPGRRVPNPLWATLRCIATSAVFMVGVLLISDPYGYAQLVSQPDAFLALPLWLRFARLQVAGFAARQQYYAIWKLAEGACVLSGLGYNAGLWDRVTNVRIRRLEAATNFKQVLDNWNLGTSSWLKHYVYLRVAPRMGATAATVATYMTSAFWHGFYPGYYLTFATGALITVVARNMRRTLRPHMLRHGPAVAMAYNFAGWVLTQSTLNYVVAPFMLLSLRDSLFVWSSVGFVGHLTLVACLVALKFVPRVPKSEAADTGKAASKSEASKADEAAPKISEPEVVLLRPLSNDTASAAKLRNRNVGGASDMHGRHSPDTVISTCP